MIRKNGTHLTFKGRRVVPDRIPRDAEAINARLNDPIVGTKDPSVEPVTSPHSFGTPGSSGNSSVASPNPDAFEQSSTDTTNYFRYNTKPIVNRSITSSHSQSSQKKARAHPKTKLLSNSSTTRSSPKRFLPSFFGNVTRRVSAATRKHSLPKPSTKGPKASLFHNGAPIRSLSPNNALSPSKWNRAGSQQNINTKGVRRPTLRGHSTSTLHTTTPSSSKDNTSIITCKLCGKRLYGSENYLSHQKQHDNVSDRYFKERSFILENTSSMRSYLDSRSSDVMTSDQLRKKNLLNSSKTGLDALFTEEFKQQSKLTFPNAMRLLNDREWDQAFSAFQRLARKNNTKAMLELAKMYETGVYVKESEKEAFRWYRRAAESVLNGLDMPHISPVCDYLGVEGEGTPLDTPKKLSEESHSQYKRQRRAYHVLKALAQDQQTPQLLYWLGRCYESGAAPCGVNLKKAESYYKKSASCGDARAMCRLAVLHLSSAANSPEDEQRICAEAVKLYKNAIVHSYPKALFYLSIMYLRGKGVEKNKEESKRLLNQARDAGVHLDGYKLPDQDTDDDSESIQSM